MKKLILVCLLLQGCYSQNKIIVPVPPGYDNVKYRKSVEVVLVKCFEKKIYVQLPDTSHNYYGYGYKTVRDTQTVSIVEVVATGQRFEMEGCYGSVGDKFRISY